MKGYIHVYTGDGKGKTTSSIGLAMRAVGAGKRVAIVFFDKAGDFYSERNVLDAKFDDQIDWWAFGRERFNPKTQGFDFSISEHDKMEARRGIEMAIDIMNEARHNLLILDEINNILHQQLIELAHILDLISKKPAELELVLTGRHARPEILQAADLVTDMRNVKHYMEQGIKARRGIDY
jgi:cob(I)alamin adenosyltransferase